MASPGAKVVGRVAVRVVPDTSLFREELRAQLSRIRDETVSVRVVPNTAGFIAQVRATAAAAGATRVVIPVSFVGRSIEDLRRRIRDATSLTNAFPDVNFRGINEFERGIISSTAMASRLYGFVRDTAVRMRTLANNTARFQVDSRGVAAEFSPWERSVMRVGPAMARMSANLARIRDRAAEVRNQFRDGVFVPDGLVDFGGQNVEILTRNIRGLELAWFRVGIAMDEIRARGGFLRAMMRGIQRGASGVASGWTRALDAIDNATIRGFQNLRRLTPRIAYEAFRHTGNAALQMARAMARGFTATIRAGGMAGLAIRSLGKDVNGVSRSLRLANQTGSALGKTLGLAFKGIAGTISVFGKALASPVTGFMNLGRTGKLVVAVMSILAPAITLVGSLIAGLPSLLSAAAAGFFAVYLGMDGIKKAAKVLEPEVNKLKASLSKTFETGLTPIFNQLKSVFPVLERGLNNVASGMINIAQGLADVITQATDSGLLEGLLNNIGKLFSDLRPFFADSLAGFLQISKVASDSFGVLSGVLNKFGADWKAMVERVSSSGALTTAMQGLGTVFESIFAIWIRLLEYGITAMGRMAGPTAQFFNGIADLFFSLLPLLETLFVAITHVVSALAAALGPALQALGEGLFPIFQQLGTAIMPVFQAIGEVLGTVAETLISVLGPAVTAIMPFIQQLATTIGTFLQQALVAIQPILQTVADVFMTSVLPVLQQILPFITQLAEQIGGFLVQAFTMLAPLIGQFVTFIGELFGAIQPLIPALFELASSVLQALMDIVLQLLPYLSDLAATVFPILLDVVRMLVPFLVQVADVIQAWIPVIVSVAGVIIDILGGAMNIILGIIEYVWPTIRSIIQAALDIIAGIIKTVTGIITGDWDMAWEGIKQILSAVLELIVSLIVDFISTALDLLGGLLSGIGSIFSGIGNLLLGAGRALVDGFLRGIQGAWDRIVSWVRAGIQGIRNLFPFSPAKEGPLSGRGYVTYSGKALAEDFAQSIRNGTSGVVDSARSLIEATADVLSAPLGIGAAIESGIPDAVQAMSRLSAGVKATAGVSLTSAIEADGFGNIGDKVADALEGWTVEIDGNGMAKIVNKSNTKNRRR